MENVNESIDWSLCCLCQQNTTKDLRHPSYKECHLKAYQALEDDLKAFDENNIPMRFGMTLGRLNDGSGIAHTLGKNQARYHHGGNPNPNPNPMIH